MSFDQLYRDFMKFGGPTARVIRMSLIGTSTPLRYGMVWQTRILRLIESRERVWGESVLGCPAAGMGQSQAGLSPLRYPAPAYGAGVWTPGEH